MTLLPDLPAAACRDVDDPDIFFPDIERGRIPPLQNRAARRFCARCPEQLACLEWALDTDERYGIWGGTTRREREHMAAST